MEGSSFLRLLFPPRHHVSKRTGIKRLSSFFGKGFWVDSVWGNKQCFQIYWVCAQVRSGGEEVSVWWTIHSFDLIIKTLKKGGGTWLIYTVVFKCAYTFMEMSTGGLQTVSVSLIFFFFCLNIMKWRFACVCVLVRHLICSSINWEKNKTTAAVDYGALKKRLDHLKHLLTINTVTFYRFFF